MRNRLQCLIHIHFSQVLKDRLPFEISTKPSEAYVLPHDGDRIKLNADDLQPLIESQRKFVSDSVLVLSMGNFTGYGFLSLMGASSSAPAVRPHIHTRSFGGEHQILEYPRTEY